MTRRTHYQVLGVHPDAEDLVIKAAYRALAQRYHPDKWDGDKVMAQQRMAEINAAYAVLSDAAKRREYDAELKSTGSDQQFADDTNQDDEFADYFNEKEDDWKFAVQFFPEIEDYLNQLYKINRQLAVEYKILLLESKSFKQSEVVFQKIKRDFLSRYFGSDRRVLMVVEDLLRAGNRKLLLNINQAIRVLGPSFDLDMVLNQFSESTTSRIPTSAEMDIKEGSFTVKKHRQYTYYALANGEFALPTPSQYRIYTDEESVINNIEHHSSTQMHLHKGLKETFPRK